VRLSGEDGPKVRGAFFPGAAGAAAVHPCGGFFQCLGAEVARFVEKRIAFLPVRQPATGEVFDVVLPRFIDARPRHICQVHFQFLARGAVLAALRDVLVAAPCRLHHLVVMAVLLRDVTVAKAAGEIVEQLRHLIGFQIPVAAVLTIDPPRRLRRHRLSPASFSGVTTVWSVWSIWSVHNIPFSLPRTAPSSQDFSPLSPAESLYLRARRIPAGNPWIFSGADSSAACRRLGLHFL
jgi:hypothetical protein